MATLKQINANRRNAQLSTGPRTPEGKQTAALNALQTGIYAHAEVLPTERPEDLRTLAAEYHNHHRPATPEARDLVDSLVRHAWLLRRFAAAEAALFRAYPDDPYPTRLDLLQRRINAAERNFHRSLQTLQDLGPEPAETPAPLPDPPQHAEPKTTSTNLASFPQPANTAQPQPAPAPEEKRPSVFWQHVDEYDNKILDKK